MTGTVTGLCKATHIRVCACNHTQQRQEQEQELRMAVVGCVTEAELGVRCGSIPALGGRSRAASNLGYSPMLSTLPYSSFMMAAISLSGVISSKVLKGRSPNARLTMQQKVWSSNSQQALSSVLTPLCRVFRG